MRLRQQQENVSAPPAFGRFLTADPLSGDIADPQSLNRYAYAANDPTDLSDPSGNCYSTPALSSLSYGYNGASNCNTPANCPIDASVSCNPYATIGFNPNFAAWFGQVSRFNEEMRCYAFEVVNGWNPCANPERSGPWLIHPPGGHCASNPNKLYSLAGDVRYSNPFNAKMAFQPWVAAALSAAFRDLNAQGIVPSIGGPSPGGLDSIAAYRTSSDQVRAQAESGNNPAGTPGTSMHQAAEAIDINGINGPQGAKILRAMLAQGFHRVPGDMPHFQMPPYVYPNQANPAEVAAAGAYMAVCTAGTILSNN